MSIGGMSVRKVPISQLYGYVIVTKSSCITGSGRLNTMIMLTVEYRMWVITWCLGVGQRVGHGRGRGKNEAISTELI